MHSVDYTGSLKSRPRRTPPTTALANRVVLGFGVCRAVIGFCVIICALPSVRRLVADVSVRKAAPAVLDRVNAIPLDQGASDTSAGQHAESFVKR